LLLTRWNNKFSALQNRNKKRTKFFSLQNLISIVVNKSTFEIIIFPGVVVRRIKDTSVACWERNLFAKNYDLLLAFRKVNTSCCFFFLFCTLKRYVFPPYNWQQIDVIFFKENSSLLNILCRFPNRYSSKTDLSGAKINCCTEIFRYIDAL